MPLALMFSLYLYSPSTKPMAGPAPKATLVRSVISQKNDGPRRSVYRSTSMLCVPETVPFTVLVLLV